MDEMKESREKDWEELDQEGQLERMRMVVLQLQGQVSELQETVDMFRGHSHIDGKLVIEYERMHYGHGPRSIQRFDDNWF